MALGLGRRFSYLFLPVVLYNREAMKLQQEESEAGYQGSAQALISAIERFEVSGDWVECRLSPDRPNTQ